MWEIKCAVKITLNSKLQYFFVAFLTEATYLVLNNILTTTLLSKNLILLQESLHIFRPKIRKADVNGN